MMIILQAIAGALLIIVFGMGLSKYADVLSDRLGIGKSLMGIFLLAAATSLPELITTINSVVLVSSADMAIGNVMGSNNFNIMIIGILQLLLIPRLFRRSNVIAAYAGMLMLGITMVGLLFPLDLGLPRVHIVSYFVLVVYFFGMYYVVKAEKHEDAPEVEQPGAKHQAEGGGSKLATPLVILVLLLCAGGIVGAGTWMVDVCDQLAIEFGLGRSFVGGLFLATATSLPELVVSITAVRLGQSSMAFGNVFGSNMFNLLILVIVDIIIAEPLYHSSAISVSDHTWAALLVLVTTLIALTGGAVVHGPSKRRVGIDTVGILGIYGLYTVGLYFMTSA